MDERLPQAEALAIEGERIKAVGSLDEVRSSIEGEAEWVDLLGRTIIPGFNDDHIHLLSMGDYFSRPLLGGLTSAEVIAKVAEFYRDAPPGEVLYGQGWDYPTCPDPHRALLDRVFTRNPVALFQYSGHGVWVNSLMLSQLGIDRNAPDPKGGRIVRDERGEPTGILLDAAAHLAHVRKNAHTLTDHRSRLAHLRESLRLVREQGITSVQDNTWYPQVVDSLLELEREGQLTLRVSCWADGRAPLRRWRLDHKRFDEPPADRREASRYADGPGAMATREAPTLLRLSVEPDLGRGAMITRGPVKYFLDGTFSTRTAWLFEPYLGEAENRGIPMGSPAWIEGIVRSCTRGRRQAAFHAIGDRAVHELVEGVAAAAALYPWATRLRMRIEHGQLIREEDISRIRDLGMVVSAQPHALGNPEKDRRLLGEERADRAYPYRSLLDAGAHLAFGSDIPGEGSFEPLRAIHNAVNRESSQRITITEALRCYTLGSAYAQFKEREKGSLVPGKLADLAILSANPLVHPADSIKEIRVDMTIVGGRIVFDRAV